MTLTYRPSSAVGYRPAEVDATSSPTTAYVRKDFEQGTDEDGNVVWRYQEAKLTRAQYAEWLAERNAAQIAYVAMMADVEMGV